MSQLYSLDESITKLLEHFRITVETPAFQELHYNAESKTYTYDDPDVSDDSQALTIYDRRADADDAPNSIEPLVLYIELRNQGEQNVTEELARLFANSDFDVDQFIDDARDEY